MPSGVSIVRACSSFFWSIDDQSAIYHNQHTIIHITAARSIEPWFFFQKPQTCWRYTRPVSRARTFFWVTFLLAILLHIPLAEICPCVHDDALEQAKITRQTAAVTPRRALKTGTSANRGLAHVWRVNSGCPGQHTLRWPALVGFHKVRGGPRYACHGLVLIRSRHAVGVPFN